MTRAALRIRNSKHHEAEVPTGTGRKVCPWRLPSAGHCTMRESASSRSSATGWNFPEEPWNLVNYDPMLQRQALPQTLLGRLLWSCSSKPSHVTLRELQKAYSASKEPPLRCPQHMLLLSYIIPALPSSALRCHCYQNPTTSPNSTNWSGLRSVDHHWLSHHQSLMVRAKR